MVIKKINLGFLYQSMFRLKRLDFKVTVCAEIVAEEHLNKNAPKKTKVSMHLSLKVH